jgi:hypothetical protein
VSDEVSGGLGAPGRGRAALVVLVAVVVAVLAVTALRRGVEPPPAAAPPPIGSPPASTPPTPALALGDVCRPVKATGRYGLDVSFSLRNNSDAPVALVAVEPKLPLAGLLERGYTIRSGTCPPTGRPLTNRTLTDNRLGRAHPVEVAPTGWVVATLHFALPDECPKPYPVQVVVTEMRDPNAASISTRYPLLNDLGEVSFASC